MFLDADERLLLFHPRPNPLTQQSLSRFAEVGVRTVNLLGWAQWDEIEPSPGVYDWSIINQAVDMHRRVGLKVVVQLYGRAPGWLEGLISRPDCGGLSGAVNPDLPDAMVREAEFIERACEHLTAPGVNCGYAIASSSERVLPLGYDRPYTMQQCVDLVMGRQRIFAKYSDELWGAWHPGPAVGWTSVDGHTKERVGNEYAYEIFEAMRDEFPNHVINRLVYTYFWGGPPQWPPDPPWVKMWVGAEHCANVVGSAKRMQPYGVWGLIMGHSNALEDPRQPHDWEFDNTAKALEILGEYHEKEKHIDRETRDLGRPWWFDAIGGQS